MSLASNEGRAACGCVGWHVGTGDGARDHLASVEHAAQTKRLRDRFETCYETWMSNVKKPTRARLICALEGCTNKFEPSTTGRKRHYCCDLHRAQASRHRRQEAAERSILDGRALATNSAPPPGALAAVWPELRSEQRHTRSAETPSPEPAAPPPPAASGQTSVTTHTVGALHNPGRAVAITNIYVREELRTETTFTPAGGDQ